MSFKIGGFINPIGDNQISNNTASTTPIASNRAEIPERYTGGSLSIKVLPTDSQAQLAWRGLYKHAHEAGLSNSQAREFADAWVTKETTYNHHTDGQSIPFTDDEFKALKKEGKTNFDLTKEFDAKILADLNKRVDAITVDDPTVMKVETNIKLTAKERAAYQEKLAQAGQNKAALQDKAILTLIDGKTKDGKPINADTALTRYIQQTYNPKTDSGSRRVWGDKINEMVSQAKTDGVQIDLRFNEDGTALVGVNAADKQKLDGLFNDALGKTILGEKGSEKAQKEETGQVVDIPIMAGNGIINTANHVTEPIRGALETLGVDTSAAKIPKIPYQSEYGKKNGVAGEIGTEIGVGIASAPSLLKTAGGKVIFGMDGAYNVAAGAAGIDPTEHDENGKPREMGTLERGMRVVGGAGEILGARPSFETAGKTGTTLAQESEVVEALTPDGQVVKVQVPKSAQTATEAATAKPVQTADDLTHKIVTVDSNGKPSGTRFRDDYETHIKSRDYSKLSQKTGVSGAHDMAEFEQYTIKPGATQTKDSINIISKTPHPTVKGIYKIEYQMPRLDTKSQPTGAWRDWKGTTPFTKTVYDSSIISDAQMAQWGREAFAEAQAAGRVGSREWTGYTPNGLKIHGYLDDQGTNAVRSFFVEF